VSILPVARSSPSRRGTMTIRGEHADRRPSVGRSALFACSIRMRRQSNPGADLFHDDRWLRVHTRYSANVVDRVQCKRLPQHDLLRTAWMAQCRRHAVCVRELDTNLHAGPSIGRLSMLHRQPGAGGRDGGEFLLAASWRHLLSKHERRLFVHLVEAHLLYRRRSGEWLRFNSQVHRFSTGQLLRSSVAR
jgi:hypothetical protein